MAGRFDVTHISRLPSGCKGNRKRVGHSFNYIKKLAFSDMRAFCLNVQFRGDTFARTVLQVYSLWITCNTVLSAL